MEIQRRSMMILMVIGRYDARDRVLVPVLLDGELADSSILFDSVFLFLHPVTTIRFHPPFQQPPQNRHIKSNRFIL